MFLLCLILASASFLLFRHYQKAKNLPPGPFSLPLIGNIHQLAYHVWKQGGIVPAFNFFRKKYGNIFTVWMGPFAHVCIVNYEIAHEVFVKNGKKYGDRFLSPLFCRVQKGHGLFFANGEIWAEMRRFTMLTFRNMGVGRDIMEKKIMEELDERCALLDSQAFNSKTIVQISDFFELLVGSIINNLLIGKRFDEHNQSEFYHIRHLLNELKTVFTIFDTTCPVWILKKFFPKRYQKTANGMNAMSDYVSKEAQKRFEEWKSGNYTLDKEKPKDFVDAFLSKMENVGENSAYNMKSLKYVLTDLWSAGHDTTSSTLISGFNQLVNNPEVIQKIRKELLEVTIDGSRPLSLKDRNSTFYFNATLAEIQRHASILNVVLSRVNHETTTVNGYTIGPGALISTQLGALHVNEELFKDPENFYPERFLENPELFSQLIPFGIGKRSCIGEILARSELYLIFGNLLLRYDIQPHEKLPSTADQLPYSSGKIPDGSAVLEFLNLRKVDKV